jgi:hypothetical protein
MKLTTFSKSSNDGLSPDFFSLLNTHHSSLFAVSAGLKKWQLSGFDPPVRRWSINTNRAARESVRTLVQSGRILCRPTLAPSNMSKRIRFPLNARSRHHDHLQRYAPPLLRTSILKLHNFHTTLAPQPLESHTATW